METTLDAFALKSFVKALVCLSKYGDELILYASQDSLSLSATNSSKSAYCRFKYERQFFSRYRVSLPAPTDDFEVTVTGQLLTKSLLSILKHRTIEKTVQRCEMSIVEGRPKVNENQDPDGLESKLVIRLHCKHGVIKTHRLVLLIPTSLMAPGVPDATNDSSLTIGPKSMKDMIEHFPVAKGSKSDPQLIWTFRETDVELKSLESTIDAKGRVHLVTELTISSEEFDVYNIFAPPTTLAFHLREFIATIAYADSMSQSLDLHFTDPAAPLFVDIEGDHIETLFVISTSHTRGAANPASQLNQSDGHSKKREREETPAEGRNKKPMKAAQRMENRIMSVPRTTPILDPVPQPSPPMEPSASPLSRRGSMPPPSFVPQHTSTSRTVPNKEPLFLPASQPLAEDEIGLGIEYMDADELNNMLEGSGEEVAFAFASQDTGHHGFQERPGRTTGSDLDSDVVEEAPELPPTQNWSDSKMFHALFED